MVPVQKAWGRPKSLATQAQSLVTAKLTEGCTCKKQVQRCHTGVASNMYVGRYLACIRFQQHWSMAGISQCKTTIEHKTTAHNYWKTQALCHSQCHQSLLYSTIKCVLITALSCMHQHLQQASPAMLNGSQAQAAHTTHYKTNTVYAISLYVC